jgi:hypothetical protein
VVAAPGASSPQAQKGTTVQARFVPVTIGIVNGEAVEIVAPEVSGSVVTLGNHLLENGSRIILPQPRTAGQESQSGTPISRLAEEADQEIGGPKPIGRSAVPGPGSAQPGGAR